MFHVRIFLRNHSSPCPWSQLPKTVQQLFAAPEGSLVWSEFYIADAKHQRNRFEFALGDSTKPRRLQADIVMLQETWGLLTLITYPRKPGRSPESLSLSTDQIESANFRSRKREERSKK